MTDSWKQSWTQTFKNQPLPTFLVEAPGRVNLIGEHVDHQNYSVLPCAIEKKIVVYMHTAPKAPGSPSLTVAHVKSSRFPEYTYDEVSDIKVADHSWATYVVAGYLGVVEAYGLGCDPHRKGLTQKQAKDAGERSPTNRSIWMMFDGNIPEAAGLSSSSALVVCASIAFDLAFDGKRFMEPATMAAVCANAERYVGTAGGGMDQAAICLSKEGMAQHIFFHPLRTEKVILPHELAVVIANTCREAPKARDAAIMYNKRVFELKAACFLMVKNVNSEKAEKLSGQDILQLCLRDVLKEDLKQSESEVLQKLDIYLEDRPYTKDEIAEALGSERRDYLLEKRCGTDVWTKNESFTLNRRVKHVLTETMRVRKFVELCNDLTTKEPATVDRPAVLKELGNLLNGSGASLAKDFECSCAEIDELCELSRKAGALGSRLTGAGWGGCTVSLVLFNQVDGFLQTVQKEYYEPIVSGRRTMNPPLEHLPKSMSEIDSCLFATAPGDGASVKNI